MILSILLWTLASALPVPPSTHVWDEAHGIKPETARAIDRLLTAHEKATQEQVVIALFRSLGEADLVTWTNQIFQHWKIGQRNKNNGVLLALYWKEHDVRLEVGYGLEPLLTDAQSKRILSEYLVPGLKAGRPDEALVASSLAILRVLQSPVIKNAEKILKEGGYVQSSGSPNLVPLLFFLFFMFQFFRNRRMYWGGPRGGGGSFGGGGGSFGGGGGSSGGGGASDKW